MSQAGANSNGGGGGGGSLNTLTPDSGGTVSPVANNINVTGVTTTDTNFETFNGGAGVLQVAHRYQGGATTSDGGGQTQTILSIPVTVASSMTIMALLSGIEASPNGVGGQITGTVFRGGGAPSVLSTGNKFVATSAALDGSEIAISVSGNNAIVQVIGVAGFTIEWYCIAEISFKSFI